MPVSTPLFLAKRTSLIFALLWVVMLSFNGQTSSPVIGVLNVEQLPVGTNGLKSIDAQSPVISADGRYVAFWMDGDSTAVTDTNDKWDVFVYDRQTSILKLVSVSSEGVQGNGHSSTPAISADGRYIAFWSAANNLAAGDTGDTLADNDVFIHDQQTGTTTRVRAGGSGVNATHLAISSDGRYVAFSSYDKELVADDTNLSEDVFVYDRQTGQTQIVSKNTDGTLGNNHSRNPVLSSDGQLIFFESYAWNLVPGDEIISEQIYVHNLQTGETAYVSVNNSGAVGNEGGSETPQASDDGRYVTFLSAARNLVGDTQNYFDHIFLRDRQAGTTIRVSMNNNGEQANKHNAAPVISQDGRFIAFRTTADNLNEDGFSGLSGGLILYDRESGRVNHILRDYKFNPNSTYDFSADGHFLVFTDYSDLFVAELGEVGSEVGTLPIRTYPQSGSTITNAPAWPQFTFQRIIGAEWYAVWVGKADYSSTALYEWYEASKICNDTTCTVPVDLWLMDGDYKWWMTYWSPTSSDYNSYWNETAFTVDFGNPSKTFNFTAPTGTVNTAPTELVWQRDPNVLWYQIWLGSADYATTLLFNWYDATEVCTETTCTVDLSGKTFNNGTSYEWWMEAWGPSGYVGWTDAANNPGTFTVNTAKSGS